MKGKMKVVAVRANVVAERRRSTRNVGKGRSIR